MGRFNSLDARSGWPTEPLAWRSACNLLIPNACGLWNFGLGGEFCAVPTTRLRKAFVMHGIIYLVGLIVVVMALLSLVGLN